MAASQTLTRGPYLQAGKQDSITLRWRTNTPSGSKVTWGPVYVSLPGTYPNSFLQDVAVPVTEHIVRIGGLNPDTKYWYSIGTSTAVLQQTSNNYFLTLPPANTTRKLRFAAFGDCGNNSTNQVNVKNALLSYTGANDIDAWLLLGDNAYSFGTDAEYQTNFFDVYAGDMLRNIKLYPAPGNHDYGNSSANTGLRNMPYHLNFTVPRSGEIGGIPSGVSNYYSFDIGPVHFISLDSYGMEDGNTTKMYDTSGAQATWLKADLQANTRRWTIAYWHHPPYTKTSHNSDTELDLVAVREKFIRILERYGVDLILCGHSHGYERSYLLKGFYNTYASPLLDADFNAVQHTATGNLQNAKYDGSANSCPYVYSSGHNLHGTVYVVSGSSGQLGGTSSGYPQNCMYYSNETNGGCFYFEVDSNRLDASFISYTTGPFVPVIRDRFTIIKDANKVYNLVTNKGQPLTLTASWKGSYYWPNNGGATTQSVIITNPNTGNFVYPVKDASTGNCLQDVFNVTVYNPLHVSLLSFDASLVNKKAELRWETSREEYCRNFTIEKSSDGIRYQAFDSVSCKGAMQSGAQYRVTDGDPFPGINFYRLLQTDLTGNVQILSTRQVNNMPLTRFSVSARQLGKHRLQFSVYSSVKQFATIQLFDGLGRNVEAISVALSPGNQQLTISLFPGIYYFIMTDSAGNTYTGKAPVL